MSKAEKAKVYFTDFHTIAFGDGLPAKLKKLIRKAGIGSIDMDGKFVAIKMHFGELGNISYLRPNYANNDACSGGLSGGGAVLQRTGESIGFPAYVRAASFSVSFSGISRNGS